ncbi:MAG TPA: Asp-tRNA(Asn)/Glu-tRNA(Gln) amidotransferase subunit GatC [Candidatus Paceibacterota bacterium]
MADRRIDVQALAELARIEMPEEELKKLATELPEILAFVDTIQEANVSNIESDRSLRNVMREDGEPHESGIYTEKLLAQAPAKKDGRFAVKQVISRKK